MRHRGEDPHHRILGSLVESSPDACLLPLANGVERHAADSQIALLLSQPLGVVREIGQQEEANDSNDKSHGTLEDEQPLPATEAADVAKSVEDTGCDQTGEGCSQNTGTG
jgi:hypothetical protein